MASFNINSPFRFGKHRGIPIGEVIQRDPDYVVWVRRKLNMSFTKEIHKKLDDYIEAKASHECEFMGIDPSDLC